MPFEMPYQGRENYHFVEDVGACFAACTTQDFSGYGAFNIPGKTIPIEDFLALATAQAEESWARRFCLVVNRSGCSAELVCL